MAQIKISALPTGTPKGTDETPATDPLDTSSAASGTTKKYIRSDELTYIMTALGIPLLTVVDLGQINSINPLVSTYNNGAAGVGATLTNASTQTALTIDGVLTQVGNRILITSANGSDLDVGNGIYSVTNVGSPSTNWVLTRTTDYDTDIQIQPGFPILVNRGAVLAGITFTEIAPGPFTIGTTPLDFGTFNIQQETFPWYTITASVQPIAVLGQKGTGYITNSAGAITITLPNLIAGYQVAVSGEGAGLWTLGQVAGGQIFIGNASTTVGVGGSVTATHSKDSIRVVSLGGGTWSTTGAPQSAGLTIV